MEDMMTQREQLDALCMDMTAHDIGDPKRIQHFMKVSAFAALIGRMEAVDEHTLFILEAVGYIHSHGAFGQIPDVPLGSDDFVVGAQIALDRSHLGGGLHDYQIGHS